MDKYSVSQLMSFPAAGVGVIQTPDGRYVSPQQYADQYYPGTTLPAGLLYDDPVAQVVAQAGTAPVVKVGSVVTPPTTYTDIRSLFSSAKSVPEPGDALRQQIPGSATIGTGFATPTASVSWVKLAAAGLVLWFLLGGHK